MSEKVSTDPSNRSSLTVFSFCRFMDVRYWRQSTNIAVGGCLLFAVLLKSM